VAYWFAVILTPDQPAKQEPSGGKLSDAAWSIPAWWLALALAALVIAAYLPALRAGFIWDDDFHLTQNPCVTGVLGFKKIWTTGRGVYYPLVVTTFWIVHKFAGLNPLPYHLLNILMHSCAAILLWRVLLRLRIPGAWLGATLWAVHPVMVESVAWITELKNTQSAMFYLLSTLFFLKADDHAPEERPDWRLLILSVVFFALAVTSKSSTVMLPIVLALCLWWNDRKLFSYRFILAPFFLIALAASGWTIWEQKFQAGARGADWSETVWQRTAIAGHDIWFYFGKLFWPARLSFIYPRWQIDTHKLISFVPAALAVGSLLFLWLKRRSSLRPVFFATVYFVVWLFPVLGFFSVYFFRYSFVADHFQYLAGIGLIVLAAAGLSRAPKFIPAALVVLLAVLTWQQTRVYRDLETLWRDTLAKNPNCWLAHNNLGLELEHRGRLDEALFHYREAHRLRPEYFETYHNLGSVLLRRGRPQEAIQNFKEMVKLKPDLPEVVSDADVGIGIAYGMGGDYDTASEYFRAALRVNPSDAHAEMNWGNALKQQGKSDEALAHFQRGVQLAPGDAEAHFLLGRMFEEKRSLADAAKEYRTAVQLRPDYAEAQRLLRELQLP
jgi:protein O-mannosyl-transferase